MINASVKYEIWSNISGQIKELPLCYYGGSACFSSSLFFFFFFSCGQNATFSQHRELFWINQQILKVKAIFVHMTLGYKQRFLSVLFIYFFFWSSKAAITKFQISVFCVIPVFSSYTFTSPQMTIQWSEYEHQFNRKLVNSLTVNCEPLHLGYNIQIWKR